MATDHILALLIGERDELTAAIGALQGPKTTEKTPDPGRKAVLPSLELDSKPPETVGPTTVKRKLSAAGRRAIIAGAKKRWAAIKAAKVAAVAPAPVAAVPAARPKAAPAKTSAPIKKGGLTEAGRKALSIAMKKNDGWRRRERRPKGKRPNDIHIGPCRARKSVNWPS
jgi:hypothetical protein